MSIGNSSKFHTELDRLQQWMQSAVTRSEGNHQGINVDEVVTASPTLSGAQRLAIYARSYQARLLQCFQAMFPALLHALGEDVFNRFATDYLRHHPPRGYTLDRLADRFHQHLAETRPDADAPTAERESWPDFIIDLALAEWSFLKVYDGPGVEGRVLPGARDIVAIGVERILEARPVPAPCLRLFAFRYPVHSYLIAARRKEAAALPAQADSFVAMTRRDYRVVMYELSPLQHGFLKALDGHRTVAAALDQCDNRERARIATVRDWLCDWAAKGFFESLS